MNIIIASWADSTLKQYNAPLKSWWSFCVEKSYDPFLSSADQLVQFLTKEFNSGASYGSLNSARAAIGWVLSEGVTNDLTIKQFFKGVFRLRPVKPKYSRTWDVDVVLDFLETRYPLDSLSLQQLSEKVLMLLALCTAHRVQTFAFIDINNISIFDNKIEIKIPDSIKTSRPSAFQPLLLLPFFHVKKSLCAASAILHYLKVTKDIRGENKKLFIATRKPFGPVKAQSLSRWIKDTLKQSGINTNEFTAHSTRHAATSTALQRGVDISTIRNTAGWSERSSVFAKFYNRPIVRDRSNFALTVLSKE